MLCPSRVAVRDEQCLIRLRQSSLLLPEGGSETVSRNDYKLVQTPQVFTVELLKRAYAQDYKPFFTDDASVVEALGQPVHLVSGNRENIKLTTPFDLKVAESLIDD
jgi:2-C-methyl-D-erythritol 4-phosphate cytidylyltransferase